MATPTNYVSNNAMNFKLIPILSAAFLLASSLQVQAAPKQPPLTTNAECKNLYKVNDMDDLLYQMYTNIDSHCLFEMPTTELEKIWGIPIFEMRKDLSQDEEQEIFKKRVALGREQETIFLEKNIEDTHQYFKTFYTDKMEIRLLFHNPNTTIQREYRLNRYPKSIVKPQKIQEKLNKNQVNNHYFWLNTQHRKDLPIIESNTTTSFNPLITPVYFFNKAEYSLLYIFNKKEVSFK